MIQNIVCFFSCGGISQSRHPLATHATTRASPSAHQKRSVYQHLLPMSAGFSFIGTCLQLISFSRIFLTRFLTNCLYLPLPRIQCSATVLSSQPQTLLMGKPCWTCFTFCTRFAAICPTTSSNQGIISPFFVDRNFAITRPCTFVPDGCSTTA